MTLVTATIRDPNGNLYTNALVVASFIGQSTVPGAGPYTAGGVPQGQFETVVPGNTDSFGVFSLPITGNDIITPTPSTWRWTVVSSTIPPVSFAVNIQITGANQDISAALQAAAAPLNPTVAFGNITVTGLTDSGLLLLSDGTAVAPSLAFANASNSGFFNAGGGIWAFTKGGIGSMLFSSGGTQVLPSSGSLQWTLGTISNAVDTSVSRNAAGVVQIGTSGGNSSGSLALGGAITALTGSIRLPQSASIVVRNSTNVSDQIMARSDGTNGFVFGANNEIATAGVTTLGSSGLAGSVLVVPKNDGVGKTVGIRSDGGYSWSNSISPGGTFDLGLSRLGVGVLGLGNGTIGDFTGSLKVGNGAFAGNSLRIGADNNGFWASTPGGTIAVAVAGVDTAMFTTGSVQLGSGKVFNWASSAGATGAGADTGISRTAAATVAIGNGSASDTSGTLALANIKTGAGTSLAIPATGSNVLSDSATQTATNKRVTPRQVTLADAISITPTSDTADINTLVSTQLAGTLTVNAPTGTPTDGQKLILRLKATNAQTYSFNGTYHFSTSVAAPTTLAAGKTDYIGLMWNATNTAWDVVAVDQGHV